METDQQRIVEDLSGIVQGEVRCDSVTRTLYASDASLYQIVPMGVVFPRHRDDVITVAKYATDTETPLVARGAGSGLAGQSLGKGLIVDFSRYMNEIEEIDSQTVRVQPGIVLDRLNRELHKHGRYFPPDPSTAAVTTVGGMIAVDAAGSHAERVGSTRHHVERMDVVLADGTSVEMGEESLDFHSVEIEETDALQVKRTIVSKLAQLLNENRTLIEKRQPPLVCNSSGYFLRNILREKSLNLPRMLVGSEGTLALTTSAVLHTSPLPAHRGVVLFLFGELEEATKTVNEISSQQPSACDLLDRRILSLARDADPRFAEMISPSAEAALFVEQTGYDERQVKNRVRLLKDAVKNVSSQVVVAQEAYTDEDVDFMWTLPREVVSLLAKLDGEVRPQPFVEDVAVPPEMVREFLVLSQKVFQKHQVTASLYAHVATGQLHLRPFLETPGPSDGQRLEAIARDLYRAVHSVGGTISGEHGDGLVRTAFIRSQYGPLYRVFQQIKDIFDPHSLFNPGKIVSDDPHITSKNLRPELKILQNDVETYLEWQPEELMATAERCNGCSTCRTQDESLRMCPFFRLSYDEQASPRAKANYTRNRFSEFQLLQNSSNDGVQNMLDSCFNCKQCLKECPSQVNIPQLVIEEKAAQIAKKGLMNHDWIVARAPSLFPLGSTFSFVSNWAIANPGMRWLMEKFLGISRHRKLPRFARRTFLRSLDQQLLQPPSAETRSRTVAYFVGDYVNYFDPALGNAFVAVMKHHGYRVYVPKGQTGSGMSYVSTGDLENAREIAEQNVRTFVELARDGIPIVCTEPADAVCLKIEYPMLVDHPDKDLLASQVVEAGEFLNSRISQKELQKGLSTLNVNTGYHLPCHQRLLTENSPLSNIISLIPGLRMSKIEKGCSGMAGTYGISRKNFRQSINMGSELFASLRDGEFDLSVSECSSCRMQMEQGVNICAEHPLKLLAASYGYLPGFLKSHQQRKKN